MNYFQLERLARMPHNFFESGHYEFPSIDYTIPCTTAAIAGVTSHLFLFIKGEWDTYAPHIAASYAALHACGLAALIWGFGLSRFDAGVVLFALSTSYCWGLFTSMTIYRLFFHRLKTFPGPIGCKITGFWSMKNTILSRNDFKWHAKVRRFHMKDGDFVRISESTLWTLSMSHLTWKLKDLERSQLTTQTQLAIFMGCLPNAPKVHSMMQIILRCPCK
jgi:hypothetical protein